MAKTPEQIAKDLARVEELYKSLGKENPFKGADPENISKSVSETEKLRNTLAQVTDEVDRANQSFSDLYDQLKNINHNGIGITNFEMETAMILADLD